MADFLSITVLLWLQLSITQGEDFLLAFPGSPYRDTGDPYVQVSAGQHGGIVRIRTGSGTVQELTVEPFKSNQISDRIWIAAHGMGNKSLLLSTEGSGISVYGYLLDVRSRKILSPLPVNGLGTMYTVVNCEELGPMNLLIAAYTPVEVTVKFKFRYRPTVVSLNGTDYHSGDAFTFSLLEYQTYTFQVDREFTGTAISSSSPVAVFIEYESFVQLIPDRFSGYEFVISMAPSSTDYRKLQITSYQSDTQVLFSNGSVIYLPHSGTYRRRFENNDTLHFTSDKPVSVSACTDYYYLDMVPPSNLFPSLCAVPECPTNEEIIILSYKTTDVNTNTGSFSWSSLPESEYQLGRINITSNTSVWVASQTKFSLLAYCSGPSLFTYCGYNISSIQNSSITDWSFTPSKHYLFAVPGTQEAGINAVASETGGSLLVRTQTKFEMSLYIEPYSSEYRSSLSWLVSTGVHNTTRVSTESSLTVFGGFDDRRIEYTPLENDQLGKMYTVITCEIRNSVKTVLVVASHIFAVEVKITLKLDDTFVYQNKTYSNGDIIIQTMDKHKTFFLSSDVDLTGTVITSNETIAVYVGQMKSGFLLNYKQLLPHTSFGCDFIALPPSSGSSLIVLGDNTDVKIVFSTNVTVDMNDRDVYKQTLTQNEVVSFRTSKPVQAALCSAEGVLSLIPPMHLLSTQCCVPECPNEHRLAVVTSSNGSVSYRNSTSLRHVSVWTPILGNGYKISFLSNEPNNALCFKSEETFLVLISCPPTSSITQCGLNYSNAQPQCFEEVNPKVPNDVSDNSWTERDYWIVVVGAAVLVVLVTLLVLLPYCLWRRRNIVIMKLVYAFQSYEDDDEGEFDAFLSYCSTEEDEKFIVHTLFPKLEKEWGFKTCVYFRDFEVGETIANNIIWAVQNSRRTLMLISPSYVRSEFCQFEYHKALQEMLRQKQRIIPILFKDITETRAHMDNTLKTILNSIIYIEWPRDGDNKKVDQFWKKLKLSLPKRRPKDVSELQ